MKKINDLKRISCLIILIVLFFSKSSFAQQGAAKTLWLDAQRFNPGSVARIAHYNVIVSKGFLDRDSINHFGYPSGNSWFQHVIVEDGIVFDDTYWGTLAMSGVTAALMPTRYSVHFGEFAGEAVFENFTAQKFIMLDESPIIDNTMNHAGKKIYDIAERINVESGDVCDVVIISKNKDLSVTRSTIKFDAKVAGVISESPKICMGSIEAGYKPLALAGIVKCNVNTQNGPIKRGDILVTSSEPGYAMRADEGQILPGMIVGSALDSLAEGKGRIYILIN